MSKFDNKEDRAEMVRLVIRYWSLIRDFEPSPVGRVLLDQAIEGIRHGIINFDTEQLWKLLNQIYDIYVETRGTDWDTVKLYWFRGMLLHLMAELRLCCEEQLHSKGKYVDIPLGDPLVDSEAEK